MGGVDNDVVNKATCGIWNVCGGDGREPAAPQRGLREPPRARTNALLALIAVLRLSRNTRIFSLLDQLESLDSGPPVGCKPSSLSLFPGCSILYSARGRLIRPILFFSAVALDVFFSFFSTRNVANVAPCISMDFQCGS